MIVPPAPFPIDEKREKWDPSQIFEAGGTEIPHGGRSSEIDGLAIQSPVSELSSIPPVRPVPELDSERRASEIFTEPSSRPGSKMSTEGITKLGGETGAKPLLKPMTGVNEIEPRNETKEMDE